MISFDRCVDSRAELVKQVLTGVNKRVCDTFRWGNTFMACSINSTHYHFFILDGLLFVSFCFYPADFPSFLSRIARYAPSESK